MSTKSVRVGVVGCGTIAPTHIEGFSSLEDVTVAWLCDLDEAKARKLADRYDIAEVGTDHRQLLATAAVDCVVVCTDHASHADITVDALEAGCHVLCEKALGASTTGMDRMLAAHATTPGLVFSGVFQHRFDHVYRMLKQLVDDGQLGNILTAGIQMRCKRTDAYYRGDAWRGTWELEGGSVLMNQAIHYIDLLAWITGGIGAVCGSHANLTHADTIETEDTATAALRFTNGALGTIEATCSSHFSWDPGLFVQGTRGSVDIRDDKALRVVCEDQAAAGRIEAALAPPATADSSLAGKDYYGTGHAAQIADFVAAIRERRAPFVTAASARHAVDVALAIYQSDREGRWIALHD
jgi:UDP-N-acetyl-2-amino-2-deoxyglucuronate dehydrogenase